jgi:transcription antitermination factor NusG
MYYVVQVKTGKEEKTIESIKKQLKENLKSKADSIDVFSPFKETRKKYKDGFKTVIERCFPGYIFVETDDPKELFTQLYFTPEYTKLLGREGYSYICSAHELCPRCRTSGIAVYPPGYCYCECRQGA